jgi:curved DNA-binding protein CbpA
MPMPDPSDLYKILQVDPEADPDVIQAAYRRLAQKHHPDRAQDEEARRRMVEINRAWEVLRDPARRVAYDRERALAAAARGRAGDGPAHGRSTGGRPAGGEPRTGAAGPAGPSWDEAVAGTNENGRPGEPVSPHWTSGRSTTGGGYDPATMRAPDGTGAAGPPPGNPSGSILRFGRYAGWSLGEIGRRDLEYLEWLERAPVGRQYRAELDDLLRRAGRRRSGGDEADRRGLFRR